MGSLVSEGDRLKRENFDFRFIRMSVHLSELFEFHDLWMSIHQRFVHEGEKSTCGYYHLSQECRHFNGGRPSYQVFCDSLFLPQQEYSEPLHFHLPFECGHSLAVAAILLWAHQFRSCYRSHFNFLLLRKCLWNLLPLEDFHIVSTYVPTGESASADSWTEVLLVESQGFASRSIRWMDASVMCSPRRAFLSLCFRTWVAFLTLISLFSPLWDISQVLLSPLLLPLLLSERLSWAFHI